MDNILCHALKNIINCTFYCSIGTIKNDDFAWMKFVHDTPLPVGQIEKTVFWHPLENRLTLILFRFQIDDVWRVSCQWPGRRARNAAVSRGALIGKPDPHPLAVGHPVHCLNDVTLDEHTDRCGFKRRLIPDVVPRSAANHDFVVDWLSCRVFGRRLWLRR